MSYRVTLPCSRAQAEALPDSHELFPTAQSPPVLVADEPDPERPDEWLLHAYFEQQPGPADLAALERLGNGPARLERLGEDDWVSRSQAGLEPIRAGRFFVHTPVHRQHIPAGSTAFEIDAGLAFGTGHHATTTGCLAALDRLERSGRQYAAIADIGTGTGLLAFAALALWSPARCIASDIDPTAIAVARDNALINGIRLGHGHGELLLAEADGLASPLLAARAPFDLLIANILAGPLVELAGDVAAALAPGGTLILAGLLAGQAEAVAQAYAAQGLTLAERGEGEWPVLVMQG